MARTRNIKPAFFQDDKLAEEHCSFERLLLIGLSTIADFKGCLENRPKKIKAAILPYDDINIIRLLDGLTPDYIRFYTEQGQSYIKILAFEDDQHPHNNEIKAGSEIPDYNEQCDLFLNQPIDKDNKNKRTEKGRPDPDLIGSSMPLTLKPYPSNLKPQTSTPKQVFGGSLLIVFEDEALRLKEKYPLLNLEELLPEADKFFVKEKAVGDLSARLDGFLGHRELKRKEGQDMLDQYQKIKDGQKDADREFMADLEKKKAGGDLDSELRYEFIKKYSQTVYNSWVRDCTFYHQEGDKVILIGCPNAFVKNWLLSNFHGCFDAVAEKRGLTIDYMVKKEVA